MPEHYTKNTLECTAYCNRCGGPTQHRVDTGRRGPCLSCIARNELQIEADRIRKGLEKEQKDAKEKEQPRLF